MSSRFIVFAVAVAVAYALAACASCQTHPPDPRKFVSGGVLTSTTMSVVVTCSDDQTCVNNAPVCGESRGCGSDGTCTYVRAAGCTCFEGDLQWCPGSTSTVHFCAETQPGVTAWQSECGPGKVACSTGIPDCDDGTKPTHFDVATASWIVDKNGACTPVARCPAQGETRGCSTGDAFCPTGTQTYSTATGWSTECVKPRCPHPEVCNGADEDLDGSIDEALGGTSCNAAAAGDCAEGTLECRSGAMTCRPGQPRSEFCDDRDNDCDGAVDDLDGAHNQSINDGILQVSGGLFGASVNFLVGPQDCGGTRVRPQGTRLTAGNANCGEVGWANDICESNPDTVVGNSNTHDACVAYRSLPNNGNRDCRFIVHAGVNAFDYLECQVTHIVSVPNTCW